MAVSLPNFNLTFDLWVDPATPATDPPDFTNQPCQLYVRSKADIDTTPGNLDLWWPPIYLRVPLGVVLPQKGDVVQVHHLALDYYKVAWTQNIHMGFPNEYVLSLVRQCTDAGVIPRP